MKDQEYIEYLKSNTSIHSSVQKVRNPQMFDTNIWDNDFNKISNKTADFNIYNDKENASLNSVRNVQNTFYDEQVISYGKITRNRSKSKGPYQV